jgi:hypothetical protein
VYCLSSVLKWWIPSFLHNLHRNIHHIMQSTHNYILCLHITLVTSYFDIGFVIRDVFKCVRHIVFAGSNHRTIFFGNHFQQENIFITKSQKVLQVYFGKETSLFRFPLPPHGRFTNVSLDFLLPICVWCSLSPDIQY